MADAQEIIQIPTAFGALWPNRTWKAVPTKGGRFTSRDLLDATYGQVFTTNAVVPCVCGKRSKSVNDRVVMWWCSDCEGEPWPLIPEGETLNPECVVRWKADSYERFANRWWVRKFGRRSTMVVDLELVRTLDKRSGLFPKPAKPLAKLQSYSRPANRSRALPVRKKAVKGVPANYCSCIGKAGHDAGWDDVTLSSKCNKHPNGCGVCGLNHAVRALVPSGSE